MFENVRIPLLESVPGHGGPVREIVLRHPTYDDYIACGGEPYSYGQSEEGIFYSTERPEVIWAYADRLLVAPKDPEILRDRQGPGSWRVAREVRKAILGFFREAEKVSEPSPISQTTSSSNSDNPSMPSDA